MSESPTIYHVKTGYIRGAVLVLDVAGEHDERERPIPPLEFALLNLLFQTSDHTHTVAKLKEAGIADWNKSTETNAVEAAITRLRKLVDRIEDHRKWMSDAVLIQKTRSGYRLNSTVALAAKAARESARRDPSSPALPARNPSIAKRDGEISSLRDLLFVRKLPIVLLTGMPGIGKTEIAIELTHWAREHGHPVHWLDGRTEPPPDTSDGRPVWWTFATTASSGPRPLLVCDGVDDIKGLLGRLPTHCTAAILLTSWRRSSELPMVPTLALPEDQQRDLLTRGYFLPNRVPDTSLEDLRAALDGHTLLLARANSILRRGVCNAAAILRMIDRGPPGRFNDEARRSDPKLTAEPGVDPRSHDAARLLESVRGALVSTRIDWAASMLVALRVLAVPPPPRSLVFSLARRLALGRSSSPKGGLPEESPLGLAAIDALREVRLVLSEREDQDVRAHALVRLSRLDAFEHRWQRDAVFRSLQGWIASQGNDLTPSVMAITPHLCHTLGDLNELDMRSTTVCYLVRSHARLLRLSYSAEECIARCRGYLSLLRRVGPAVERRVWRVLIEAECELEHSLGVAYMQTGLPADAAKHLASALHLMVMTQGPDRLRLSIHNRMARCLLHVGNTSSAKAHFDKAKAGMTVWRGDEETGPLNAALLLTEGDFAFHRGDYLAANQRFEEALRERTRWRGDGSDLDHAHGLRTRANMLGQLGRFREACDVIAEAIGLYGTLDSTANGHLMRALVTQATVLRRWGDLGRAASILRGVLKRQGVMRMPLNFIVTAKRELALSLLHTVGTQAEARELAEDVTSWFDGNGGRVSCLDQLIFERSLLHIRLVGADDVGALRSLRSAIDRQATRLGGDHPEIMQSLVAWAIECRLRRIGKSADISETIRASHDALVRRLGTEHPETRLAYVANTIDPTASREQFAWAARLELSGTLLALHPLLETGTPCP